MVAAVLYYGVVHTYYSRNGFSSPTFGDPHIRSFPKHRSLPSIFQVAAQEFSSSHSKLGVETPVSTLDICRLVKKKKKNEQ